MSKGKKGKLLGLVSRVYKPLPGPHEGRWLGARWNLNRGRFTVCLVS